MKVHRSSFDGMENEMETTWTMKWARGFEFEVSGSVASGFGV